MAASRLCSRICRSSSRSARPFATSSSCSSRWRSWRPSTLDDLLAIAEGRSAPPSARLMAALWIPAALGIATTVALNSGLLGYGRYTFSSAPAASVGVAIVTAVTLLVYLAGRRARWAIAALVVVTALDLGVVGHPVHLPRTGADDPELTQAIPPAPDDPAESYAAAPESGRTGEIVLVLRGYRLTTGYVGLFPATRHPLDGDIALRLSGTRWIFTRDGVETAGRRRGGARAAPRRARASSTGSARLVVDRPGHLVVEVDAPGRGTLAFTERFHDGWSATIDGAPAPDDAGGRRLSRMRGGWRRPSRDVSGSCREASCTDRSSRRSAPRCSRAFSSCGSRRRAEPALGRAGRCGRKACSDRVGMGCAGFRGFIGRVERMTITRQQFLAGLCGLTAGVPLGAVAFGRDAGPKMDHRPHRPMLLHRPAPPRL